MTLDKDKYRLLKVGETIQRFDEYFDEYWRSHERFHIGTKVNSGHYPIRRELETP